MVAAIVVDSEAVAESLAAIADANETDCEAAKVSVEATFDSRDSSKSSAETVS